MIFSGILKTFGKELFEIRARSIWKQSLTLNLELPEQKDNDDQLKKNRQVFPDAYVSYRNFRRSLQSPYLIKDYVHLTDRPEQRTLILDEVYWGKSGPDELGSDCAPLGSVLLEMIAEKRALSHGTK